MDGPPVDPSTGIGQEFGGWLDFEVDRQQTHALSHLTTPIDLIADEDGGRWLQIPGVIDDDGTPILAPLDDEDHWLGPFYQAVLRHRLRAMQETTGKGFRVQRARAAHRALCQQPYGLGHLYWLMTFGWVIEPRNIGKDAHLPFIPTPRQIELVLVRHHIVHQPKATLLIEKSRAVGVTWIAASHHAWGWQFEPYWESLVSSIDADAVDKQQARGTVFAKIDHLLMSQPAWLLPAGYNGKRPYRKTLVIRNPETGSVIEGMASNVARDDQSGRGLRGILADIDEAAFKPDLATTFDTLNAAVDHRIVQSTVSRKHPAMYAMWKKLEPYQSLEAERFSFGPLQWPGRDEAWLEQQRVSMGNDIAFRREFLMDWDADYEQLWIYPEIRDPKFYPRLDVVRAPGCLFAITMDDGHDDDFNIAWAQLQPTGEIEWLANYSNRRLPIRFYGHLLLGQPRTDLFSYTMEDQAFILWLVDNGLTADKTAFIYGDKHGLQTSLTDGKQPFQILLEEFGIYVQTQSDPRINNIPERRDAVRDLIPRFRFSSHWNAPYIRMALMDARLPERSPESQATTELAMPVDTPFSHARTAVEYFAINHRFSGQYLVVPPEPNRTAKDPPASWQKTGRRATGNEVAVWTVS